MSKETSCSSCSRTIPFGPVKLSRDLSSLVNNRQGSDVCFQVGGGDTRATVEPDSESTLYAHSVILRCRSRYFSTMLGGDKEWKEKASGIIRKPNISPVVFHVVLYYIYTGWVDTIDAAHLLEVIAAAEEMELHELSVECQNKVIAVLDNALIFEMSKGTGAEAATIEDMPQQKLLPFGFAFRTLVIPGLTLAYYHTLGEFYQKLLNYTFRQMNTILASTETLIDFFEKVPSPIFKQILASNNLALSEFEVWDLALSWACHRAGVLKPMVEAQLRLNPLAEDEGDGVAKDDKSGNDGNYYNDGNDGNGGNDGNDGNDSNDGNDGKDGKDGKDGSDSIDSRGPKYATAVEATAEGQTLVTDSQLRAVKAILKPLLPAIRFTFIEPEQYASLFDSLAFFVTGHQSLGMQRFFSQSDQKKTLDVRRGAQTLNDSGIADRESWMLLMMWIFETESITGCLSPADSHFQLLYRATQHGFRASVFHSHCDKQGPTLVLARSVNGRIFGGVNFNQWDSPQQAEWTFVRHRRNFLFALRDGRNRLFPASFGVVKPDKASCNQAGSGPIFGAGYDLSIADQADSVFSTSEMPASYAGAGASNTALAGYPKFLLADYEVFKISAKLP